MWRFDVSLTRPDAAFLMLDEGTNGLFALLTADLRELERGLLQRILCASAAAVPWWTSQGLHEFADSVDRHFGLVREPRKLCGGALAAAAFTRTDVNVRVLGDVRVGLVEATWEAGARPRAMHGPCECPASSYFAATRLAWTHRSSGIATARAGSARSGASAWRRIPSFSCRSACARRCRAERRGPWPREIRTPGSRSPAASARPRDRPRAARARRAGPCRTGA